MAGFPRPKPHHVGKNFLAAHFKHEIALNMPIGHSTFGTQSSAESVTFVNDTVMVVANQAGRAFHSSDASNHKPKALAL